MMTQPELLRIIAAFALLAVFWFVGELLWQRVFLRPVEAAPYGSGEAVARVFGCGCLYFTIIIPLACVVLLAAGKLVE